MSSTVLVSLGSRQGILLSHTKHIRICPRRRVKGPRCPLACALSVWEEHGQAVLAPDAGGAVLPQHGAPPARHRQVRAGFAVPRLLPGTDTVRQPGPSTCHSSGLLSLLHRKAAQGFPLGAHRGEIKMKLEWDIGHFVFGAVPAPGKR